MPPDDGPEGAAHAANACRRTPPHPLEELPARVAADPALVHLGRFMHAEFLLEVGDVPYHVRVTAGRVEAVERGPFRMRPWHFAVRATEQAWQRFWSPVPPPGYHDLLAMSAIGAARIEGDLAPLRRNLRYVKELLATLRCREG